MTPSPTPTPAPISKTTKRPTRPTPSSSTPNPNAKPTIWQRYQRIPLKWKLYIGTTTFIIAFLADSISDKLMERNMIDYEANRRVEIEMSKLKLRQQQGQQGQEGQQNQNNDH
ncbi:unnamed protein product [Ambrosiozyma monospora]|uniref:Unnamed protein product n=1 Tax=Ambrosiozyma monospora TaxID=43982 RepID=A0ACB5T1Q3_AMBMO|nr:unnamed protein product [Ambrosiozyma monospora]